jgi:hypothetical protein
MVWGAISMQGAAQLWIVPHKVTVNSNVYMQILEERLHTSMADLNCFIFQQDGAPCHMSKAVKGWLNSNHIPLLQNWPGSSADLNPIENCWALLKREVAKLKPTSQLDLQEKVKTAWTVHITPGFCKALIDSMPSRINAVLAAKGGPTKY